MRFRKRLGFHTKPSSEKLTASPFPTIRRAVGYVQNREKLHDPKLFMAEERIDEVNTSCHHSVVASKAAERFV